jgi:hypothetical protein
MQWYCKKRSKLGEYPGGLHPVKRNILWRGAEVQFEDIEKCREYNSIFINFSFGIDG